MGHRTIDIQLLLLSVSFILLIGSPQYALAQPQTADPLQDIQQEIIAVRNEFKLWIQKTDHDQETIHQHIGDKLTELLELTEKGLHSYAERVEKATELQTAINSYNGGIYNLEDTLGGIEVTMNAHLDQIEQTLTQIKASGVPRRRNATEPGGLPVPSATAALPDQQGDMPMLQIPPGQLFRAAYGFYMEGDYDTSIAGFQKYLIDYPDTQLAGAAQYWIAESLTKLEEYEIALAEYEYLITQYPQNDKLPDGYYGKASVLLKLGQTDAARQLLQYVADHYRGTIAARKAGNRLQEIH